MKMFIVLVAVLAVALAAPPLELDESQNAQVTKYANRNDGVEGYKFVLKTSDGVHRKEKVTVLNAGTEQETISTKGKYSFVAPDGIKYTVKFIADENGFQPSGEHLPGSQTTSEPTSD